MNLIRTSSLLALTGALLGFASTARAQAPLFFDAFLFDNGGQPAGNFNAFILWNVSDGTVDLTGGNVPGANDPVNGRFVDLDGSTSNAGLFATRLALPFAAGTTYRLSFDYFSTDGSPNAATVTIGGQVFSFASSSTTPQGFSQDFFFGTATTSTLAFQDLGNDSVGMGIDNILLTTAVVPEPSTWVLLAVAAGALLVRISPEAQRKA